MDDEYRLCTLPVCFHLVVVRATTLAGMPTWLVTQSSSPSRPGENWRWFALI
jgi:hypothetical protein